MTRSAPEGEEVADLETLIKALEKWSTERDRTEAVLRAVNESNIPLDDQAIAICERLELPIEDPTYADGACQRCCALVASEAGHSTWHRRLMAFTKVDAYMGGITAHGLRLTGALIASVINEILDELDENP